jgi:hypothetical protein
MYDVRAVRPTADEGWWAPVMAGRWWAAVSGGRFYTWWSALVALPLAATVLGSFGGVEEPAQASAAVALSAAGWVMCVLMVLPAAWAERRLARPLSRAAVVLGVLVLVSVLRPALNDLLVSWWSPREIGGELGLRIAVNLIAWFALMSMVAVAVNVTASASGVNRRLRGALAALAGDDAAEERGVAAARTRILETVSALRRDAAALREGPVDFDRVRDFSEAVREASHDLDEAADAGAAPADQGPTRSFAERLAPPPIGMVGVVFTASSVPYAMSVMTPAGIVVAACIAVGLAIVGDVVMRRLIAGRDARTQGLVVIGVSAGVGVALSLAFFPVLGSLGAEWLIPVVAFPVLTVLAAIAEGAIRRAEAEQRSLTEALSAFRSSDSRRAESAPDLLRTASAALHGEVQGRCVVFAASLDDGPATPAQVEDFIAVVGGRLDRVLAPQTDREDDAFAALIEAWSHVLDISCEADDDAARALTDAAVARRVADITSEAFVNAVKHSAAKEATVTVAQAAPGVLAVRVAAPGRLRGGRRNGLGLARLGVPARLTQRGGDVVLAAAVPYRLTPASGMSDDDADVDDRP